MRRRSPLLPLGSMLALVLASLGCWAWLNRTQPAERAALAAAQDRWAQRAFTHYSFVLERRIVDIGSRYHDQTCQQEIDVNGEGVAVVRHSTCPAPAGIAADANAGRWFFGCTDYSPPCPPSAMTVDELFGTIATYLQTPHCGPNGCGCDGRFVYEAEYDATLGYPVHMELRMQRSLGSTGPCSTMAWTMEEPALTVRQFVPEPVQ